MENLIEHVDARGIATLTLNRPDRYNAFDDELIAELIVILDRLAARADVRVLVLASSGPSFSAGADLVWMRRQSPVFLCEGRPIDAALAGERSRRIAERRASAEGREGVDAFLNKRVPTWRLGLKEANHHVPNDSDCQ